MPEWRNWTGDRRCVPRELIAAADEEAVVAAVRRARERSLTLRVVGAGHSFSDLVPTDGMLLRLDGLNQVVEADASSGLARVQAGMTLARARRGAGRARARAREPGRHRRPDRGRRAGDRDPRDGRGVPQPLGERRGDADRRRARRGGRTQHRRRAARRAGLAGRAGRGHRGDAALRAALRARTGRRAAADRRDPRAPRRARRRARPLRAVRLPAHQHDDGPPHGTGGRRRRRHAVVARAVPGGGPRERGAGCVLPLRSPASRERCPR